MKKTVHLLLICLFAGSLIRAQVGSIDSTFMVGSGFGPGSWGGRCEVVVQQPDGKLLVGGWFTEFDSTTIVRLARLHPNGTLDASFQTGDGITGVSAYVRAIALQTDGKILVGGNFLEFDGTNRHRLVRLNSDGSLDNSFDIGTGFNSDVNSIVIQPDGKILVAGIFTKYDWLNSGGVDVNYIARLNSDGSLDNSFSVGSIELSTSGQIRVNRLLLQPDGKVLAAGQFTGIAGTERRLVLRLNSDGSLDTGFGEDAYSPFLPNSITGFYGEIMDMQRYSDGRIVVTGNFEFDHGTFRSGLAVMHPDGSRDSTFSPVSWLNLGPVALQADGKLIVGVSGINRVRRYLADGSSEDSLFPQISLSSGPAQSIIVQGDGNVVLVGHFTYNPTGIMRVIGDTPNPTSNEQIKHLAFGLYPNPAGDGVIHLSGLPEGSSVRLMDINGRELLRAKTLGDVHSVKTAGLPVGLYLVEVWHETGYGLQRLVLQ